MYINIYIYTHIFYYIFPDSMLQGKTQHKGWQVRSSSTVYNLTGTPGISWHQINVPLGSHNVPSQAVLIFGPRSTAFGSMADLRLAEQTQLQGYGPGYMN